MPPVDVATTVTLLRRQAGKPGPTVELPVWRQHRWPWWKILLAVVLAVVSMAILLGSTIGWAVMEMAGGGV